MDDRERTIAGLRRELAGARTTLGRRLFERGRTLEARARRVPGLREGSWAFRRAVEVLLDDGFLEVARKTGHKLALAARGRNFLVRPRKRRPLDINEQYQRWLARQERRASGQQAPRAWLDRPAAGPIVSLLAIPARVDPGRLGEALEMLGSQHYPRWELCVAVRESVRESHAAQVDAMVAGDPRLRLAWTEDDGGDLAAAYGIASGDLVGVVDVRDSLDPGALLELVGRLDAEPTLDAAYGDEDVIDLDGRRVEPFFKPDWSPDLLLATDYVVRLGLVRRSVLESAGGVRGDLRAGAAWDLWLRATEQARAIAHVPKVLYHRRACVPTVDDLADYEETRRHELLALQEALRRRGLEGTVARLDAAFGAPPAFATRLGLRSRPLVSVIIPTRDKPELLEQTIRTVRERTGYDHYEIIVVDNDSREPATLAYLDGLAPPCRVLRWPGAFNFSAINNAGAKQAKGEHLLFLNNDVEVLRPDWLSALIEHSQRPEVGAVGAKLLYPDGRIQHAGVVVGVCGLAVHAFRRWPGEPPGAHRLADLVRNCSAVTAACMMVRRGVFEQVGGFDEFLRVVFNDVDLCLRIRGAGYRIVYTPLALLTHYEGASRGRRHPTADEKLFGARWGKMLGEVDPYYHPNLTRTQDDCGLDLD
jgi:GT2 family glycosyltransferase